ncbi:hypothetical protein B0H11DRAFT_1199121 [Mycena galericulata]|nr:hypothetical protein B0H11DRAFT_1199121 [Mycena galericulata]
MRSRCDVCARAAGNIDAIFLQESADWATALSSNIHSLPPSRFSHPSLSQDTPLARFSHPVDVGDPPMLLSLAPPPPPRACSGRYGRTRIWSMYEASVRSGILRGCLATAESQGSDDDKRKEGVVAWCVRTRIVTIIAGNRTYLLIFVFVIYIGAYSTCASTPSAYSLLPSRFSLEFRFCDSSSCGSVADGIAVSNQPRQISLRSGHPLGFLSFCRAAQSMFCAALFCSSLQGTFQYCVSRSTKITARMERTNNACSF